MPGLLELTQNRARLNSSELPELRANLFILIYVSICMGANESEQKTKQKELKCKKKQNGQTMRHTSIIIRLNHH